MLVPIWIIIGIVSLLIGFIVGFYAGWHSAESRIFYEATRFNKINLRDWLFTVSDSRYDL